MNSRDFIIDTLKELSNEFKYIKCRYEEDFISNAHFIEVSPKYLLKQSNEFKKAEERIISDFIRKFPDQTLSFITEDALVGLFKVDYEVKGSLYDLYFTLNDNLYKILKEYKVTFVSREDVDVNITTIAKSHALQNTIVYTNNIKKKFVSINSAISIVDDCNIAVAGETNCAIAA